MKKFSMLFTGLLFFLSVFSQKNKIDWNADLDYLVKELSEKHYNFYSLKSKDDFLTGIEGIKQKSNNLSDFQMALCTQQLIAKFGDSHTALNYRSLLNPAQILPLNFNWMKEGIYVLHTSKQYESILGNKVLSVNNIPISTVIDSLSTLITVDNPSSVKLMVPKMITFLQILNHFGFSNTEQVKLELLSEDNKKQTCIVTPDKPSRENIVSVKPDSVSFITRSTKRVFNLNYFPNDDIYYLMYNKCMSKEVALQYGSKEMAQKLPSFVDFENKVFHMIDSIPAKKFVFDMRYNSGGSSAQGTAFVKKLAKYLEQNPTTKLYVVLGRSTFSSAILNAIDFKRMTNAVFVGEETSGKPNHFGEVKQLQLPSSKLACSYSTKYFRVIDEDTNTFSPDVKIEMSFSEFMKGIDPVYDWIKQQ